MSNFYEAVYGAVRKIPRGRVATYGGIAWMLGRPQAARAVGYALRALPDDTEVPWHRVINAKGTISLRGRHPEETDRQRKLLEEEGVEFVGDRTDLAKYGWPKAD